jgi:uncharacterized protein (DUF1778 family)
MVMAATVERKEYPISMRLPEADVAMIDRAASLRGRSRTDFVRMPPCVPPRKSSWSRG